MNHRVRGWEEFKGVVRRFGGVKGRWDFVIGLCWGFWYLGMKLLAEFVQLKITGRGNVTRDLKLSAFEVHFVSFLFV